MEQFRQGVCGVFVSENNQVLLGERTKQPGQWQLPQGGIEPGETIEQALARELFEETGISDFKIRARTQNFISYRWPDELFQNSAFIGQQHIYFLLSATNLRPSELGPSEEFSKFAWFSIPEVLSLTVSWKRLAYTSAFGELGLRD